MGINLTNFLSSKTKNKRMMEFQDLDHIDGVSISTVCANLYKDSHTGRPQGSALESAKSGGVSSSFGFLTHAMSAPMSDSPRYAVSCAGPVHPPGKDHAGLVPNTLKIIILQFILPKLITTVL